MVSRNGGDRVIQLPASDACLVGTSLVARMRERTAALHATAEQSGVVAAILGGRISRSRYALYLRNLLPAYEGMERALHRLQQCSEFEGLCVAPLYRADSIVADLTELAGPDWLRSLRLLPAGVRYAARVEWAARGPRLIAHCYTRYLGDLNGGLVLGKRLAGQFGRDFRALAFTRYPEIPDVPAFRVAYRQRLDRAGRFLADAEPVVEEAAIAFNLNIKVAVEVERCALDGASSR